MKKWFVVLILGAAQFVMVLDSTVMNVSISAVVEDLDSSVTAMQSAITFYTLTMAATMLLGAKLGDIWGRRRALVIGSIVYAIGSLMTAFSPNMTVLFLGWSIIEGLGAVLVIPAIAALLADNYEGRERVTAFAAIGAVSGAGVAAGPLIGGFMTTYFSWRYVFVGEVVILVFVVIFAGRIAEKSARQSIRIDVLSVALSALGLVGVVFGMLQSKVWGWIVPLHSPVVNGVEIAPLGISLTAWFIVLGIVLLVLFFARQRQLVAKGRDPLLHVDLLSIRQLRSGLSVLGGQYAIIAGLFFMVPVYLQMTLGFDALQTGVADLPAVDLAHPLLRLRHPPVHAVVCTPGRAGRAVGPRRRARSCCSRRSIPSCRARPSVSGCSAQVRGWAFSPHSWATSTCPRSPRRTPAKSAACRASSRTSAPRSAPR